MESKVSAALLELWSISAPCADSSWDSTGHLLHQELVAAVLQRNHCSTSSTMLPCYKISSAAVLNHQAVPAQAGSEP